MQATTQALSEMQLCHLWPLKKRAHCGVPNPLFLLLSLPFLGLVSGSLSASLLRKARQPYLAPPAASQEREGPTGSPDLLRPGEGVTLHGAGLLSVHTHTSSPLGFLLGVSSGVFTWCLLRQ